MGIHLCVYRFRDGKFVGEASAEQWDFVRHAGDAEFARDILNDETKTISVCKDGPDGDRLHRPGDIAAWKAWDAAFGSNAGRWSALADLLAADPELFVYQSW